MKRTLLNSSIALSLAGLLGAGTAIAQQPAAPAASPPTATPAAPSAATQPTAPSSMTATPSTSAGAPARTESASSAFGKLDMKQRGYVSSEDVSQLQGFNFKNADKNSDGKLDATEFNAAWTSYSGTAK